jgi:predicted DNA binding CopG/RHH family protein
MIPKKINKMSIEEQEAFLMQKLNELYEKEQLFRFALAKVRGKVKIDISEIDRPDLMLMKSED